MFAAAIMAAGASGTSTCSSVRLVEPSSAVPQTNWIRNVRACSETISVGGFGSGTVGGAASCATRLGVHRATTRATRLQTLGHLIAVGLTFPASRLCVGLIAKLSHERARDGADALGPLQLPKQPRKHDADLGLDAGARLGGARPSDGGWVPQRFARYSTNRVEIKLTTAVA